MSLLVKSAKAAASLHPANILKVMLANKPTDASLVAVSQYKAALIFYKNEGQRFYADYSNGNGWEKTRYRTEEGLKKDLTVCSFILTDLEALESALPDEISADAVNPIQVLKTRVDAQFARIDGRRSAEKKKQDYWQGQFDAFEIVQSMIRDLT